MAVDSTWIALSWEQVVTSIGISSQIITLSEAGTTRSVTVEGGQANSNVTNLTSGVVYTIQVVAVAGDGQRSFPSVAITAMTLFPCKY